MYQDETSLITSPNDKDRIKVNGKCNRYIIMNKNANFVKSCQCVLLFNMEVLNSAGSVYYNVTN